MTFIIYEQHVFPERFANGAAGDYHEETRYEEEKAMNRWVLVLAVLALALAGCGGREKPAPASGFLADVEFLKTRTEVVVLEGDGGARVAVCPGLQGRVMTSAAGGPGFGWINRELLSSGVNNPHMNAFGGEDRFWLGPEGGQFSIFFKWGDPFDLDHWFTPPPVNEGAFDVAAREAGRIEFVKPMKLVNYSGTAFDLQVRRVVRTIGRAEAETLLGLSLPSGIGMAAFVSENTLTNAGAAPWRKETGLLSIWILGMFNPAPRMTVVVPFNPGPEAGLGPAVNDAYFGKVPADRLVVKDSALFFKGDGLYRSKIGLSPRRAKPVLGSYDPDLGLLTVVQFSLPDGARDYVNSMWEIQDDPFSGDVVNSYNDGPAQPGAKPLGPFYELETSSPAAALDPGASLLHVHRTFHFVGGKDELNRIAGSVLGVRLAEIKSAF